MMETQRQERGTASGPCCGRTHFVISQRFAGVVTFFLPFPRLSKPHFGGGHFTRALTRSLVINGHWRVNGDEMCASVPDFTDHVGYKQPAKKLAWGLDFKDQYRNCKHSLAWTQTTVWFGGIWTVCVGTTQPQAGYNCFGRIHCSIF